MSIPMLAVPGQSANYAHPSIGFGALKNLLVAFKLLLTGMMHAVLPAFNPVLSQQEKNGRQRLRDVLMLNRMARECKAFQPGQAAEFQAMAARDW